MNIEKIIQTEETSINTCILKAQNQYNTEGQSLDKTPNILPPDYHVLFVLVRNIKVGGNNYIVAANSTEEKIFFEAVDNFKYSVEFFAKNNVHIVPTIKEISNEVIVTDPSRNYLVYQEIHSYLKSYSSIGLYDAVLVASQGCGMGGAVTTLCTFEFENIMHGFTHIEIVADDSSRVGNNYPMYYPHLITTNFFIHEWMHQLEGYRTKLVPVYPDTHGYLDPTANGYSWDKNYFDDTTAYQYIVEHFDDNDKKTSFYRAVLAGELTYNDGSSSRYIGMFPRFWFVTPRKIVIGRYIIQDPDGTYYYNNNGSIGTSSSLSNDMSFVWNIYYSFYSNSLKIKNFGNSDATISTSYSSLNCTRVGPFDEGEYYLVNTSFNDNVLGYNSANTLAMVTYRSNSMQTFDLKYYSELYFSLKASNLSDKYLDLQNDYDIEDNAVNLYVWTSYPTAQTWQYRFYNDNYKIMPLRSPTRSLSFHNSALHINSVSNVQNWRPELVANGKYIFPGNYKIKTTTGFYLTYSGNTLYLSNTGTTWTIDEISDNYYSISTQIGAATYYFDVLNGYDIEGNTVQIQYSTGYSDAQSWKFMMFEAQSTIDENVIIVPRLSLNRGISATSTGSTISTGYTHFYLERV